MTPGGRGRRLSLGALASLGARGVCTPRARPPPRPRTTPPGAAAGRGVGPPPRPPHTPPRRKQVVLVDHNEAAQSVPGLEQADILAIIDHHRLADIQTKNPIYFRNEPVGSTTTIVAGMYTERGLMPSAKLAGLMAAPIVSDTVMFKSPPSPPRGKQIFQRLAHIAGISPEELGREIFSASAPEDKPIQELLFTDFKEFHIAGHDFGVSQITCVDSDRQLKRKDEFLQLMAKTKEEHGYSMMIRMLTDVLLEGTKILCLGGEDTFQQAFNVALTAHEA